MSDPFKVSTRKKRKEKFGAKLRKKSKALRFGAPPKKKSKALKFGKPEKKKAGRNWLKFGMKSGTRKNSDWGKVTKVERKETNEGFTRSGGGLGWLKRYAGKRRRQAELGRHWSLRDQISEDIQRQSTMIESRLKNTADEIGHLVTGISGRPLTGAQKIGIANYIDRKKQEITQGATLVDQVIRLFGSLFGKVE